MTETILKLLTTKFVGVSENILKGIAEKAAKTTTTEADAKTYVEGLTIQQIIESYADSRATGATKSAVANYEKKYNIKDGKPVTEPGPGAQPEPTADPKPKPSDDTPAWAKALIEANNALRTEVEAMKRGKTAETRSGQLQNIIKALTPTQQKAYNRIDLASMDEEAFNTFMTEVAEEVKTIATETKAAGVVTKPPMFSAGSQGTDKEASDEEVKAMMGIK